jgi:hypothetical protein
MADEPRADLEAETEAAVEGGDVEEVTEPETPPEETEADKK